MSITVPIPATFEQAVWLAMGLTFGRAFGKKLDWDIINSNWFKLQPMVIQNILSRALDCLHHWWIGALLMLYPPTSFSVILYWFGAGLLLDDLPDIPKRLDKLSNSYLTVNTPAPSPPLETPVSIVQVGQYTPSALLTPTPAPVNTDISSSPESPG
jgi:hypothetical protein